MLFLKRCKWCVLMKMEGLLVKHKTLGTGTVTKFDGKFLTVSFESKVSMFQYPVAFTNFIQAADSADQAAIMQEIEEAFGFPVYSVIDVYDIIEYLEEDPANEENVTRIKNYLAVNGAK